MEVFKMINVEIHGHGEIAMDAPYVEEVRQIIREAIADNLKPLIAITICNDICTTLDGKLVPFFRVLSPKVEYLEMMERILTPLGNDIETQLLNGFKS